MAATAVISSKGQIVIPATLRRRYRLTEGTTVVFQEERGRLVLEPSDFSAILSLEGTLKDFPLERTLQEERAKERAKEESR
jgi:AbrB family looped-hinge helix DNA binding protein